MARLNKEKLSATEKELIEEQDTLTARKMSELFTKVKATDEKVLYEIMPSLEKLMKENLAGKTKILKPLKRPIIDLKFLSEEAEGYLNASPPPKPVLLYYVEDDGSHSAFLHKEIISMLVAEGGRGKTRSLILMALCIATGAPFFDKYFVETRGATAVILGENNRDDIRRLLYPTSRYLIKKIEDNIKAEKRKFGVHSENIDDYEEMMRDSICCMSVQGQNASFIDSNGNSTDYYKSLLEELINKEPTEGWQLIILDPASRFMGMEAEKDNALATQFMCCLERLSSSLKGNPTIMMAHHANKSDVRDGSSATQLSRGSGALTDAARHVGIMKKNKDNEEGNISIFEISKTNFTKYHPPMKLKFNRDGIPEFNGWVESKKTSNKKTNTSKGSSSEGFGSSAGGINTIK
ncbi:MAG: hypothetical protein K1060chlam3_00254 [Candidatus Anoxychlamydiales bacterium]|nr:hypothetical protein [Candidatus Anoxychlamydiales bacterium]